MAEKTNRIKVNLLRGNEMLTGQVMGKRVGSILIFKGADPSKPVLWFGEPGYSIYDTKRKTNVFFYDVQRNRLLNFKELGNSGLTEVNLRAILSGAAITGAENAKKSLGLGDAMNNMYKLAAIGIIGELIVILIFLMLTGKLMI
ncbi:MAG: hypothetical protein UNLARM2_0020 [Candidatus Micrarchaeum acidiphilum ARMAN-2]|jgi:hypothetical protein|uniref:Uncharacterized protein n=1 Tax=Candidatus Micrarchaeum acidiphilum ARMAN-2 TaxID=425595 RepID=C7DG11_MICA2|nr:MAG: hypothetical protein UNLARM2_0020 [Candidatus Micrarchaeum acidiphilum ARMAN-2]